MTTEYKAGDIVELGDNVYENEEAFWAEEPIAKVGDKVIIRKVCACGADRWFRCSPLNMTKSFRVEPRDILRKVEKENA